VLPAVIGAGSYGLQGLLIGCAVGAVGLVLWVASPRATYRRAKRFVLRSHSPPSGTNCRSCEQGFDPLEPVFSCVDSGSYLHARCRKHHAHEAHPELVSA